MSNIFKSKCKPVSRVLFSGGTVRVPIIYLALQSPEGSSSLPNPDGLPKQSADEQPLIGAYLAFQLVRFSVPPMSPSERWALTPPFHLFPSPTSRAGVVCFLWHYLFHQLADLPVRKYDALCCPDFPYWR